jgi:transaldolase
MQELTACGIPVNATLVFKKEQAVACAKAFELGLKKNGSKVDTVISIFVSRVDRALDSKLAELGIDVALSGVYNTADIYNTIQEMSVDGCRALFASTGVKDDSLPAHYYVDELLAYNSINTAPIDTIKAFHKNGIKKKMLPISDEVIKEHFEKISLAGLVAFEDAFKEILESL